MSDVREGAGRTALVTGASAGIGESYARLFASHGFNVILTARRKERLEALADELHGKYGVKTEVFTCDLADPNAPQQIFDHTEAEGLHVDVLVNNAGYGVPGYFENSTWEQQGAFIQVLTTAVCHLTHLYLPKMLERGYGRILNIASLAGHMPGSSGHTLYGASKAFAIKFSESLWAECQETGVHVTAVCPGFTWSEFHDVVGNREEMNKLGKIWWMTSEEVAQQGYDAVMANKPVIINGTWNKFLALVARYLPHKLMLAVIARQSKKFRVKKA